MMSPSPTRWTPTRPPPDRPFLMPENLTILSANLGRRHSALEDLLQSSPFQILLIQEPSWVTLTNDRSDSLPTGIQRYGTAKHPAWTTFLPPTTDDTRPRVAIFVQNTVARSCLITTYAPFSSYTGIGISIKHPLLTDSILILNFYHHVETHSPCIFPLLTLPDLLTTPVILGGDFNTHFPQWPPPIARRPSPWATSLSNWLDNEGFLPLNPPATVTRESSAHRGSNIDFFFANERAFDSLLLPTYCSLSFAYSASPDHAGLLLDIPITVTPTPPRPRRGWVVDSSRREAWEQAFHPTTTLPCDIPSLTHAAEL